MTGLCLLSGRFPVTAVAGVLLAVGLAVAAAACPFCDVDGRPGRRMLATPAAAR